MEAKPKPMRLSPDPETLTPRELLETVYVEAGVGQPGLEACLDIVAKEWRKANVSRTSEQVALAIKFSDAFAVIHSAQKQRAAFR